jgi:thiol-disulfide isomerase/thioredoxin
MPKPPNLGQIDWKAVFDSGLEFAAWLDAGETEQNVEALRQFYDEQVIAEGVQAKLKAVSKPVHVIAIAEDWCPDVIRHAPALQKMADLNDNLRVRYISREDHPEVFVRFLTNGGEAIPKFIFLSDQFAECGNWGPMPEALKELIARGKACDNVGKAREKVFAAYIADAERAEVVAELMQRIDVAASETP